MPKKPSYVKHSEIPEHWNIRPGEKGGLKLTYNQISAGEGAPIVKSVGSVIAAAEAAAAGSSGAKVLKYNGDSRHGMIGVELQIKNWTHYDAIVYVECVDGRFYRLLLTKIYPTKRSLSMSQLIGTLADNKKTARI